MNTTNSALAKVLANAAAAAAKPTTNKSKTPKACVGGCGEFTKGGNWAPGHDGRTQGRVIAMMRAGATIDEAAQLVTCAPDWDLEIELQGLKESREAAAQAEAATA